MLALALAVLCQSFDSGSHALAQDRDPDVAEGVKVFETYMSAMKKAEYETAADCMHAKTLTKMRAAVVGGVEQRSDEEKARVAEFFGFKEWKDMAAASDRTFFVHFCRNMGKMGTNVTDVVAKAEAKVQATAKREGRVYVIVELAFKDQGEDQRLETLFVLYKDGEKWKLANRGETNIGK